MLGRSLCPYGKSLCYRECRRGRGTLDTETLICRGTCEWTMQPSQTLSRARPCRGSSLSLFSLLCDSTPSQFPSVNLDCTPPLHFSECCECNVRDACCHIYPGEASLRHNASGQGIKAMSVIPLFLSSPPHWNDISASKLRARFI